MLDWDHEVSTTDPRYYKWTQWIFLQLYRAGLAVKKKAAVNWCPECKTVLANEQVIDGHCERHPDTAVTQRYLEQWFFRITEYAGRLLENLEQLDWSDSTRLMQTNWIGRSEGAELVFRAEGGTSIHVFTTRPDTVFGATYMVLAPEHPLVDELTTPEQRAAVQTYRTEAKAMDIITRRIGDKEKTGVSTGAVCRNPATGESIPIWIADYVLMEYGTGAIMAVPAHDSRDLDFARQESLAVRLVYHPEDREVDAATMAEPIIGEGVVRGAAPFEQTVRGTMSSRAVVFAGQGAQTVGMGQGLAEAYPECKALYQTADEVLGYSLSDICFNGPVEELTKSNHCQPAIFVTNNVGEFRRVDE